MLNHTVILKDAAQCGIRITSVHILLDVSHCK